MNLGEFIAILQQAPPDLEVQILGEPVNNIAQFEQFINIDCAQIALDDADQVYYSVEAES